MSKLLELQKERGKVASNMRNMVDNVDQKTGMTSDQEDQWSLMNSDIERLDKLIESEQKVTDIEASLGEFTPVDRDAPAGEEAGASPHATDGYINGFQEYMRNASISDASMAELRSVRNALTIGTDSEGGFVVPESWQKTLIKSLDDEVLMRQIGTVMPTASTTNMPILVDKGAAGWVDELGEYPESDISFGNLVMNAWKLGRIIKVSEESLQDTMIPLDVEIAEAFKTTFGEAEEGGFWTGDGDKKPLGALRSAQQGVLAASNSVITYDEIIGLIHSVKEGYRRKATMVCQDGTVGVLRRLKSTDGTPLWQPNLAEANADRFAGQKLRTTEFTEGVGAGLSPISFGDFSYYRIGDRGAI